MNRLRRDLRIVEISAFVASRPLSDLGSAGPVPISVSASFGGPCPKPRHTAPLAPQIRRIAENMKPTTPPNGEAASANITKRIEELGDWRGEALADLRRLIHDADPDIEEEWKWRGVPVWSHDGIVCTGESYKQVVKLTFARGASIEDPEKLFNSSLEGNTRRAIDLREGEKINDAAFKQLIRAAVAANSAARAQRAAKKK